MPDLATALKNAINNLNTNKENEMQTRQTTPSDISNIVNEWAEDKAADAGQHKAYNAETRFQPTSNLCRAVFDLIKANPGLTYGKICELASARGYKRTSAGSLITQFVHVGMVERDANGELRALQPEYTPIKYKELRAAQEKRKRLLNKAQREQAKEKRADAGVAKPGTRPYIKSGKYSKKNTTEVGIAALGAQASGVIEIKQTPASAPLTQTVTTFDADQLLSTLSFTQAIALYKKLKAMLGEV